jgi:7,8-dihydropterin-6-yl-methyl-4-(beta-D-ribofuranosyl)aminobenzene 5'-phosphate synthase
LEQLAGVLSGQEIKMRLIHAFLILVIFLSLGACYPASTPVHMIPQAESPQLETTSPTTIPATTLPDAEGVFIPTRTETPATAPEISEAETENPMLAPQTLTITIIYDNDPYDSRLNSAWGFSALIEYRNQTLLFDTGGDGRILMENMRILGLDPARIDRVVLSHIHQDHTGGLIALLTTGAKPEIYLLPSFPASFKSQIKQFTQVHEVTSDQSLGDDFWTTGEMGGVILEQVLVVQTKQGLVVITGCAHPGVVAILERAQELFAEPVHLVLGGFHLGSKSEAEIDVILKDFRRLGVESVAPCHCTGEYAIERFAAEYGPDFIRVGVGSVVRLGE